MSDLTVYEKKVFPIADEAMSLTIENPEVMRQAVDLLSHLNKAHDVIENEEDKVLAPLKEAMKAEKARWEPFKLRLKPAIEALRKKMGAYQTEQTRLAKVEEAKIAARVGQGKGKLKVETAVAKIDQIDRPDNAVISDAGLVKFRTDKVLKITDEKKIPDAYWIINEKDLLTDLKKGKSIPGAEIEEIQTPVNFR